MKRFLTFLVFLVLLLTQARAFTLTDNSTGPVIASAPCCSSILDPLTIQYLPANGAGASGHRATLLNDFPGANVVLGGAAPGTLFID